MLPILLIHSNAQVRQQKALKIIEKLGITKNSPDLLWLDEESKLGVEQARKIKEFISLKPYQSTNSAVIIDGADNLTPEAQNALLKSLEEAPEHLQFILCVKSSDNLLQTVLSRCKLDDFDQSNQLNPPINQKNEVESLYSLSISERFAVIEKLENKEQFLRDLTVSARNKLRQNIKQPSIHANFLEFAKFLLRAEQLSASSITIRAILELAMLKMPLENNK